MSKKVRVRKVFDFSIICTDGEGFEREVLITARNKRRAIKRFKREFEQKKVDDIEEVDVYWKKGNKIYWDRECVEVECEDTRWSGVKFFDFSDYEYYALIAVEKDAVDPVAVALIAYEDKVADLEECDKEICPKEITYERALELYKKAKIEGCTTIEEKIKDFEKSVNFNDEIQYSVLLVDWSLL